MRVGALQLVDGRKKLLEKVEDGNIVPNKQIRLHFNATGFIVHVQSFATVTDAGRCRKAYLDVKSTECFIHISWKAISPMRWD